MEDLGDPGTGEGEQADGSDRPGVFGLPLLQGGASAPEFIPAEVSGDGSLGVQDEMGASVGMIPGEIAPQGRTTSVSSCRTRRGSCA